MGGSYNWNRKRVKLVNGGKVYFFWGESAGGGGAECSEEVEESSAFPQSANS